MRTVLLAVIAVLLPLELAAAPPVQSPVAALESAGRDGPSRWLVAGLTLGIAASVDLLSGGTLTQPLWVLARSAIRGPRAVLARAALPGARMIARDSVRDTAVQAAAAVDVAATSATAAPAAVPAAPCVQTLNFCRWVEAELAIMVSDVERYWTQAQAYYLMQREYVRLQTGL